MRFAKLHGLGNDYIYVNGFTETLSEYDLPELARRVSDRHFGIGSDGLILILPSDKADFRMRIFNSDGSEAEMCGNGIRGFAKYVYEHSLTQQTTFVVETGAGLIRPQLILEGDKVAAVRVDMGEPRLRRGEIPMEGEPAALAQDVSIPLAGQVHIATCVSMGNPHCVIFVEEVTDQLVQQDGPAIERHPLFPRRTNVEFARILSPETIEMRVWERGAGETMACGTGACATAVAGALKGLCGRRVCVQLRGGVLQIEWSETDNHVYMTGPAAAVCEGVISEELLALARARAEHSS